MSVSASGGSGEPRWLIPVIALIFIAGGIAAWAIIDRSRPDPPPVSGVDPFVDAEPDESVAAAPAPNERPDIAGMVFWQALSRNQDDAARVASLVDSYDCTQRELDECLWQAAKMGATNSAATLISRGADVDANLITTPLEIAAKNGQKDTVAFFLQHSRPGAGSPLSIAAMCGHEDIVLMLLARGYDSEANHLGRRALHWAASSGETSICRALVDRGAEINAIDDNGYTPLDWSDYYGHANTSRFLRLMGAQSTQRN